MDDLFVIPPAPLPLTCRPHNAPPPPPLPSAFATTADDGGDEAKIPDVEPAAVAALLAAWGRYAVAASAAEAETRQRVLATVTQTYVQLQLAQIDRQADIAAKQARAAAKIAETGNPHCAEARRERLAQQKRRELTAAMAKQLAQVTAKLQQLGGAAALAEAQAALKDAMRERKRRQMQRQAELAMAKAAAKPGAVVVMGGKRSPVPVAFPPVTPPPPAATPKHTDPAAGGAA